MPGTAAAGTLGFFAGCFLKTAVVLTLALLAAAAARRRPAAIRHFILSSALIGLLLIPLLSLAPIGWKSPLLPGWMAARAASAAGTSDAPAVRNARGEGPVGAASSSSVPVRLLMRGSDAPLLSAPTGLVPAAGQAGAAKPGQGRPFAAGLIVTILWMAGLAALLVRLAFGLAGAVRLTAEGTPLDGAAWRALVERFLAFVSLRRDVRLKSHPEVLVPLTWGWRRPVVLLPDGSDSWTDDERSSALFHELSHVKRADFLVMLLVRASLAVFWWNPLCWIVYRELQKEQEIACDELVLRAGIRPSTYAATLLAFRRSAGFRWSPSAALLGMLGRSSFQERLAAILKQKLTFMEVKMKTKIMLALALVLAVALVGTARPVSETTAEAGTTVLAETAMPAPGSSDFAAPGAGQTKAEKAVAAEQEKEKVKSKADADKTIVVRAVESGAPIVITITEGGDVKTLKLDKPLTITKSKDGGTIVLTVDGKEIEVLKGEPLRLEIKGGGIQVMKEGQAMKIGDGRVFSVVKKGDDEGQSVYFIGTTEPDVAVGKIKVDKTVAVDAGPEVIVKLRKDMKEGEQWVSAPEKAVKVVEGQPFAWTIAEGDDMLEKVRALQEQVQAIKAKKMDLSALEESLKKLEAELRANEEKLEGLKFKFERVPGEAAVIKKVHEGKAESGRSVIITEGKGSGAAKPSVFVETGDKNEGTINLIFTGQEGEAGKAAFERAVVTLKKGLPEGYKLVEQKYDSVDGTMTFKVAAPEGKKTDGTLIRKLVEMVQEQIKRS